MSNAAPQIVSKKRLTFWLIDRVGSSHREYALELSKRGFDVQFFSSLDALVQETRIRRPAVIVVGDEGSDQLVEKAILTLTSMPDILGARLVMSLSRQHENLKRFAACGAFRDLIPLNLDTPQWLSRFIFATSSNDVSTPKPTVQVTMNSIAAVSVPARIVWVSKSRLWLECRVRPHRGATLNLTGPLAEALGVESLPLTVEETRANSLTYRFSDALVASWRIPEVLRSAAEGLLEELQQIDSGPRCKVFVAVQDTNARSEILRQLDVLQFEVTTALHKMSIVEEPRFFSPHLVFIEDSLCIGDNAARFRKMLGNLNSGVPVVIIGNKLRTEDIQNMDPNRKISILPRVTPNLTQLIWKKFLPKTARNFGSHAQEGAVYVASDHLFSVALVSFAARLTRVHPQVVQMSMPFPVGQYGLLHVESPLIRKLIGRNPYAKVTQISQTSDHEGADFRYSASCTLADLDRNDQKKIAQALIRVVNEQFLGANPTFTGARIDSVIVEGSPADAPTNSPSNAPSAQVIPIQQNSWQSQSWTVPTPGVHTPDIIDSKPQPVQPTREYSRTYSRPTRSKPKQSSGNFKYFIGFVLFSAAVIGIIWGISSLVSPTWSKSGGSYSDSLKKFQGTDPTH